MSDFNIKGLRRVLSLRQFPFFEQAELDELATIAENLVETTIPAGTMIAAAGSRLRGIQLVLDGQITAQPEGTIWSARHVYGALEVFAGREVSHTAIVTTPLHTLQISAADIVEVLEDNFGVLRAALRELAARVLAIGSKPRCVLSTPHRPLGLVERVIVLRQQLPFTAARLQALATLAHGCDEVTWPGHTVIARAGEPATTAYVIEAGSVIATRGTDIQLLTAGSSIGLLETLAGTSLTSTMETTTPVRALRCSGSTILDVIEDHTDVGIAMLATFAGALLDGLAPQTRYEAPPLAA